MSRPKVNSEPRVNTAVRLPVGLHERIKAAADERDVSANWLIVRLLTVGMDRLPSLDVGTGGRRWDVSSSVEFGDEITWGAGVLGTSYVSDALGTDWPDTAAAYAALVADVRSAARLRSLAALFEQPLNRDQEHTFTGRALAEMLRGEG